MLQAVRDNVLLNKPVVHAKKVLTQSYKTHYINIKKHFISTMYLKQNDCHTHDRYKLYDAMKNLPAVDF